MVGHKAPCPNADIGGTAMLDQQVSVELIILGREEDPGAAVAPLRNVMRQTGDGNSSKAGPCG